MAIEQIVIPTEESVELLPRPPYILSLQMDLIQKYHLQAERIGAEPNIRLRILPLTVNMDENLKTVGQEDLATEFDDFIGSNSNGDTNESLYSVDRLPLLPE